MRRRLGQNYGSEYMAIPKEKYFIMIAWNGMFLNKMSVKELRKEREGE